MDRFPLNKVWECQVSMTHRDTAEASVGCTALVWSGLLQKLDFLWNFGVSVELGSELHTGPTMWSLITDGVITRWSREWRECKQCDSNTTTLRQWTT